MATDAMGNVVMDGAYCRGCGQYIHAAAPVCPHCGFVQHSGRNRVIAALLALFLGGFGVHKFYLGRWGWGLVYLIFCWTVIPTFVGFVEGIIYLGMSDERFAWKYR